MHACMPNEGHISALRALHMKTQCRHASAHEATPSHLTTRALANGGVRSATSTSHVATHTSRDGLQLKHVKHPSFIGYVWI
jgi:hypothetical protein